MEDMYGVKVEYTASTPYLLLAMLAVLAMLARCNTSRNAIELFYCSCSNALFLVHGRALIAGTFN